MRTCHLCPLLRSARDTDPPTPPLTAPGLPGKLLLQGPGLKRPLTKDPNPAPGFQFNHHLIPSSA